MVLTLRDAEDRQLPDVPEIIQSDNGALILRKKRQRKLQNLGTGVSKTRKRTP
jgi:hypothetical protein